LIVAVKKKQQHFIMYLTSLVALLVVWLALVPAFVVLACSNDSRRMVLNPDLMNVQTGAAGYLKGGWASPCPERPELAEDDGPPRVLRYCYADAEARSTLHCGLMRAFKLWADALGHDREQGNALAWIEANDGAHPLRKLLCFEDDYVDFEDFETWNSAVEPDTLANHLTPGVGQEASSTVVYLPAEWEGPEDLSASWNNVQLQAYVDDSTIAHEASLFVECS
jgi:hypothetical protein